MAHITTRDYRQILDLAVALVDGLQTPGYQTMIAAQLNDCLRGTATLFMNGFNPSARTIAGVACAPGEVASIPWAERARVYGAEHPLAHAFAAQRDPSPLTVSDVVTPSAWRATQTYDSCDRDLDGGTRHLAIPLPTPIGVATAFIVCRSGRDFTDRERDLAAAIQPLVIGVGRQLAEARRLQQLAEAQRLREPADAPAPGADFGLTPRELTVLALLGDGLSTAAVARRLLISGHTVNKHLENAYRKCGTRDRLATLLLLRRTRALPPAAQH
jgi:DNA-binding CsgD family transcriptional regulator